MQRYSVITEKNPREIVLLRGQVRDEFINKIYPQYKDNPRVDILLHNADFGVGD